jgi:hypothetical protein
MLASYHPRHTVYLFAILANLTILYSVPVFLKVSSNVINSHMSLLLLVEKIIASSLPDADVNSKANIAK